jgi:putative peptide zinc metalloprotease protein
MRAAILPPLREELTLHDGPVGFDGAPSWTLHDPVRNLFFRLTWPAFEMLSRWDAGGPERVAAQVAEETTLEVEADDVLDLVLFLERSQLLQGGRPRDSERLRAIAEAQKLPWLTWLLHHYLFFRIPLVRPDRLLDRLQPRLAWLGSRRFITATLLALAAGLFLTGRQWEVFRATLVDRFTLSGIAAFGVTLALAKIIHEMGHALVAKSLGCRVPTMGVAFLVMWPVLYTDVNEAWKFTDRRRRLMVGAAGIYAELTLAAWATLAWGLLPIGAARDAAFVLAATSWISSVTINLSPFMRFDGYFLLMDGLDMPNLHNRSFALARWWLREKLCGLGDPVPEPLPPRRRAFLIGFAFAVWIYRLVLFLGIAALVYHFFIKLVGVALFAVEIGWFVARPVVLELAVWRQRAGLARMNRRTGRSFLIAGALLLLAVVPWSGRIKAPAVLKAADHASLYAPQPGRLVEILVRDGQAVKAGDIVARLDMPDIDYRLAQIGRHIAVARYRLSSLDFEQSFRDNSQVTARELETGEAEQAALRADRERAVLTAPFDGVVTDIASDMAPGEWVGTKDPLLAVRAAGAVVDAYVSETDLPRLSVGAIAHFLPEEGVTPVRATVFDIDRTAVHALGDPEVASPFGGAVAARSDRQALIPDNAVYRVRLSVTDPLSVPIARRGQAVMSGGRQSLLDRAWRAVAAVILREWGA